MVRHLTQEHKDAMVKASAENKAVKVYLESLDSSGRRPGRKRSPEKMRARLGEIAGQIESASPMKRVTLVQERIDIERSLAQQTDDPDLAPAEDAFVEVAAAFSTRKGISKKAWREVGVPAAVLKRAGV